MPDAEDHAREHGPHGRLMPGMVGERELARLAAADGRAFDRLFVDYMIRHHRGAIGMARVASQRAEHAELQAMAEETVAETPAESPGESIRYLTIPVATSVPPIAMPATPMRCSVAPPVLVSNS